MHAFRLMVVSKEDLIMMAKGIYIRSAELYSRMLWNFFWLIATARWIFLSYCVGDPQINLINLQIELLLLIIITLIYSRSSVARKDADYLTSSPMMKRAGWLVIQTSLLFLLLYITGLLTLYTTPLPLTRISQISIIYCPLFVYQILYLLDSAQIIQEWLASWHTAITMLIQSVLLLIGICWGLLATLTYVLLSTTLIAVFGNHLLIPFFVFYLIIPWYVVGLTVWYEYVRYQTS